MNNQEKFKIYYNNQGWVCQRYPYDLPVENEEQFIEVSSEEYCKTLISSQGYAWRIVEGKLINEVYDAETVASQSAALQISDLKGELAKIKEDIEQEVFGLVRDDYEGKKQRAAEIINELRVLEGKKPRDFT